HPAVQEGRPPPEHAQIKALDRKAHTITLAVGDFDAITLDYEKDVTANAQASYDRRKEGLLKAQRAEEAIAKTKVEVDAAKENAVKALKKPSSKTTKSLWYEAYRTARSSSSHLIL